MRRNWHDRSSPVHLHAAELLHRHQQPAHARDVGWEREGEVKDNSDLEVVSDGYWHRRERTFADKELREAINTIKFRLRSDGGYSDKVKEKFIEFVRSLRAE